MCPFCLTTLAFTVGSTAGAAGGAVAFALRIRRALAKSVEREPPRDAREVVEPPWQGNHEDITWT